MTEKFLLMYKKTLCLTAISSYLSLVFVLKLYFVFLLKFSLISRLEKSQFYLTACFTSLSLQCSKNCQFCLTLTFSKRFFKGLTLESERSDFDPEFWRLDGTVNWKVTIGSNGMGMDFGEAAMGLDGMAKVINGSYCQPLAKRSIGNEPSFRSSWPLDTDSFTNMRDVNRHLLFRFLPIMLSYPPLHMDVLSFTTQSLDSIKNVTCMLSLIIFIQSVRKRHQYILNKGIFGLQCSKCEIDRVDIRWDFGELVAARDSGELRHARSRQGGEELDLTLQLGEQHHHHHHHHHHHDHHCHHHHHDHLGDQHHHHHHHHHHQHH